MPSDPSKHLTYSSAGVDTDAALAGLSGLLSWVRRTKDFREGFGEQLLSIGFFASVLRLTGRLSLAISTDGVGSKSVVAQLAGQYESIGWDCVAVNVNDVICTGAEPMALVDYISLQYPHEDLLTALGKGLHDGAERARVSVVGGELSQHPDSLAGPREGYAFDISGTCVGVLDGIAPNTGTAIAPGDVVLGMPSNGIHANGLTLARRLLLQEGAEAAQRYLPECGRSVAEELLRPTHIYVPEVMALLRAGIDVHGLAHISGGGLLNLTRLDADVAYVIDVLPDPPPVFGVIQQEGGIGDAEMFRVFNMGVGFCVVVPPDAVGNATAAVEAAGGHIQPIGRVAEGPGRQVIVSEFNLTGAGDRFTEGLPSV